MLAGVIEFTTVRVAERVTVRFAVPAESEDPIARWVQANDVLDEAPLELAFDLVRPGYRCIDLGAHIGSYSLPLAASGCEVLAVEGSPTNARLLREAAINNGFEQLHVVNAAASDRLGEVRFLDNQAWGRLLVEGEHLEDMTEVTVQAVPVSDLVIQLGWDHVDFIKIDIEGGEVAAIRGLRPTLERDHPVILFESNALMLRQTGTSAAELHELVASLGYRLFILRREGSPRLAPTHPAWPQPEALADFVAITEMPDAWRPWVDAEEPSTDELVSRFLIAAYNPNAPFRVWTADVLRTLPEPLRSHPELRQTLAAMRDDVDPLVATTAG